MDMNQNRDKEQYERARSEFDRLRGEDKAVFLLEATVASVARGVETLGRQVAEALENAFRPPQSEPASQPDHPAAPFAGEDPGTLGPDPVPPVA